VSANPGIDELKRTVGELELKIRALEREVEHVSAALQDDPRYGREGLFTQIRNLREEHRHLKDVVRGFERRDAERDEELRRRARRDFPSAYQLVAVFVTDGRDARVTALKTRLSKLRDLQARVEAAQTEADVEAIGW
jgi:hypothetical protein